MSTTTAVTKANDVVRFCACSCGQQVNGKSVFRQGHDAKLVSRLVKETIDGKQIAVTGSDVVDGNDDIQAVINHVDHAVRKHFGGSLAAKYENAAMNAWTKSVETPKAKAPKAKAPKEVYSDESSAPEGESGTARIGRWQYQTITTKAGRTYRNTKVNGSGDWIEMV